MTSPWPSQSVPTMNEFYGDPDNHGSPSPKWEELNLVNIIPPYHMVLAWAPETMVSRFRIHRKCHDSILQVLDSIASHFGTQEAINASRMHLFGGSYAYRPMRGGHALSIHSWGAAIDLDPERNAFGKPWDERQFMMPHAVVDIFGEAGWTWGGRWSKPDAMHFQAADVV